MSGLLICQYIRVRGTEAGWRQSPQGGASGVLRTTDRFYLLMPEPRADGYIQVRLATGNDVWVNWDRVGFTVMCDR